MLSQGRSKRFTLSGQAKKALYALISLTTLTLLFLFARKSRVLDDYDLVFLQIIHRHGDRTPIQKRMYPGETSFPKFPCALWSVHSNTHDTNGLQFIDRMSNENGEETCPNGWLTVKGCLQLKGVGLSIRNRYDQFLQTLDVNTQIHVRSTNYPRTMRSLECLFHGIDIRSSKPLTMTVADTLMETMYPRRDCESVVQLLDRVMSRPVWKARQDLAAGLRTEVAKALNISLRNFDFQRKSGWGSGWDKIYDQLRCRLSHSLPFPGTVTTELYERVADEAGYEMKMLFDDVDVVRAGIGALVGDLLAKLQDAVNNKKRGLDVYSGHDLTLMPLLASLLIFDGKWPDYASHIEILLLRREGAYFVRLMYENSGAHQGPMAQRLPWCDDPCPFPLFYKKMHAYVPASKLSCGGTDKP